MSICSDSLSFFCFIDLSLEINSFSFSFDLGRSSIQRCLLPWPTNIQGLFVKRGSIESLVKSDESGPAKKYIFGPETPLFLSNLIKSFPPLTLFARNLGIERSWPLYPTRPVVLEIAFVYYCFVKILSFYNIHHAFVFFLRLLCLPFSSPVFSWAVVPRSPFV